MILNNFQKEIISQIIEKKVHDIETFFTQNFMSIDEVISDMASIDSLYTKILDYLKLIEYLEKEDLIFVVDTYEISDFHRVPLKFYNDANDYDYFQWLLNKIDKIFEQKSKFDVHPLLSLEYFRTNDYKTNEEIEKDRQDKYRSKSLNITLAVAIVSIILSLFTVLYYLIITHIKQKD